MKIYYFSLMHKFPNDSFKYVSGYVFGEDENDVKKKLNEKYNIDHGKIEYLEERYIIEN